MNQKHSSLKLMVSVMLIHHRPERKKVRFTLEIFKTLWLEADLFANPLFK